MKIEFTTERSSNAVNDVSDLAIGTVFFVEEDNSGLQGRTFLRTYHGLVDLGNPQSTWESPTFSIKRIIIYPNAKVVLGEPK